MIDDHVLDGNHINGIIDLTDKGIVVRQSFTKTEQQSMRDIIGQQSLNDNAKTAYKIEWQK